MLKKLYDEGNILIISISWHSLLLIVGDIGRMTIAASNCFVQNNIIVTMFATIWVSTSSAF